MEIVAGSTVKYRDEVTGKRREDRLSRPRGGKDRKTYIQPGSLLWEALIGRQVGDLVIVDTAAGTKRLRIEEIR